MKKFYLWKSLFFAMLMCAATAFTACVDDDDDTEAPYLEITPTTVAFGEDGVATDGNYFEINTNRPWKATMDDEAATWITLSQYDGNGPAKVTVSVPEGPAMSGVIEVSISNQAGPLKTEKVTVTRGEVLPEQVIFSETAGTASISSPWPLVGAYNNWNTEGIGADEVTYSGTNTSVRSTGLANAGSGPNVIFFGTAPATFVVNKIALTAEQTNLKLTFLASYGYKPDGGEYDNTFDPSKFKVALSGDGKSWVDLEYTRDNGDAAAPYWVTAVSNFTLKEAVSFLYIRFTASASSAFRLDDIVLVTGNGGQVIDLEGGVTPPDPAGDALFYESFGNGDKVNNKWAFIDQYTDYIKQGEAYVEGTTSYSGSSASVRTNSFNSNPVPPFSGAGHVWFASGGGTFTASKLLLKATQTKLRITLGVLGGDDTGKEAYDPTTDNLKVEVSGNGNSYVALEPTFAKQGGDPDWSMVTADFTLKKGVTDFYIRVSGKALRIDDLTLAEGSGGTEVDLENGGSGGELPEVKLPTTVETTFSDTFETAENKKIYTSSNWAFFSNDPAYPATPTDGWMGGTFTNSEGGMDKYIQIAPYASSLSEVVAYAVMAPLNVKAAASKTLSLNYTWFYQTADDSKFEVVVSTKATDANAREAATWTVVKNLTFDASHPKNEWTTASIDLSAYASSEKLYVALRYTGKDNTYRVDDVKFNDGGTATPTVTTTAYSDLTDVSFTSGGSISGVEAAKLTEVGIQYIVFDSGTIGDLNWDTATKVKAAAVATPWSVTVTGLTKSTQYAYRAYATTADNAYYGEAKSLVTTEGGSEATTITIPDLLKKITNTGKDAIVLDENVTYTFEAVICSDPAAGNASFGTLYVMTSGATTGGNGLALYNPDFWTKGNYKLGDKVKVTLPAGVAKQQLRYSIPQIAGIGVEDVVVASSGNTVTPIKVSSVADIANYYAMPVTISATAPEAGLWMSKEANTTHQFTAGGTRLDVYVNQNAAETFLNVPYAATTGDITGIASVFSGQNQVLPRNLNDVKAFDVTTPTITVVDPGKVSFTAEGGSQKLTVKVAGGDGALSVSDITPFKTSINGYEVTVTADANTGDAISKELTISIAGGNSIKVPVSQAAPSQGGAQTITMVVAGVDGFPEKETAEITDVNIDGRIWKVFKAYKGSTMNYLMLKSGSKAYLETPAISGATLKSITIKTGAGASTTAKAEIVAADGTVVSAEQLLDKKDADFTFTLTGAAAATPYRILATVKNVQITQVVLQYE